MKEEEDFEESKLIENQTNPKTMAYTDGRKIPIDDDDATTIPAIAPPPYEKVANGFDCNCETAWRIERLMTLLYPSLHHCPHTKHFKNAPKLTAIGDLVRCSGVHLLAQFHADCLKQVGFGKFHWMMIFVCGLSLGAQIGQIFALFFVLPSADMEFCMLPEQKDLLTMISLLGAAFGALNCGAIAGVNGRKRTLVSCMICTTLFSVVSAFMPTFGPFAMARFCAAACGGGIFPVAAVYIGEMVPAALRARCIGAYTAIGLFGGTIAAVVSVFLLPMNWDQLMMEQKTHFGSWHRYLLYMTLSSFLPIFGLSALPESPRWLLDCGREADAMEAYKAIYIRNRLGETYDMSELQFPTTLSDRVRTPFSMLRVMTYNAFHFMDGFGAMLRPPHKRSTTYLMVIWFCAMFVAFGLAFYILKFGRMEYERNFLSKMVVASNFTYENISFSTNIVNQRFSDSRFLNCTFEQIVLTYVQFKNCTFLDTNFHAVKTANTTFVNSFLNNVKFIDTDITRDEFTNCAENNTKFDRLVGGCDRQYNFNFFTQVALRVHRGWIIPTVAIVVCVSGIVNVLGRVRTSSLAFIMATLVCFSVGFVCLGDSIYWIVGIVQGLVIGGLVVVTVQSFEFYNVYRRCTALGMCVCSAHFGAITGLRLYSQLPLNDVHIAAVVSVLGLSIPSLLTSLLRENSFAL